VSDDEAEDFDPTQPQIVHSVGTRSPAVREPSVELDKEKLTESTPATPVKSPSPSGESTKQLSSKDSVEAVNEDET